MEIGKQSTASGFSKQIKAVILPLTKKYPLVYFVDLK
jgi:hypothetical protein